MQIPEPTQRLAPNARTLWRVGALGGSVVVAAITAAIVSATGDWDGRPGWFVPVLWALVALFVVVRVVIEPELRYSRWRYAIHEEEIDIRHGVWSVRRTLVPIARVQHVDTQQGLLEQMLHVATVVFHTAAGKTTIPALEEPVAQHARERIATLARGDRDV
jgi:membrane protein YdbS with pleckstrin-like domain